MEILTKELKFSTKGNNDIKDLTPAVENEITSSGLKEGSVTVFTVGSTASITTLEYEPGLLKDIPEMLEEIAPYKKDYEHHKTWGDYNGGAHIRSALLGPGIVIPFMKGKMVLGTWQQIALMDFDDRPRDRRVIIQIIGV